MSPDVLVTETPQTQRKSATEAPPLKILVVSTTLESGRRFPAPVEFANALVEEGMSVLFAAAVGPLRKGLSRSVGYLMVDDAESAPVKTSHELMRLVHHHKPDVVHAHGARCAVVATLAVKACRSKCARVMTHYTPGLKRFPKWIKGPVLRGVADRFFVANESLAEELEGLGVPAACVQVEPVDERHASAFARHSIEVYRELVAGNAG